MDKQEQRGVPAPASPTKSLVSIILWGCDQPRCTRRCLAALSQHTPRPWELILLPEGAAHPIAADLESLAGNQPLRVHQAIRADGHDPSTPLAEALGTAEGDYLVLLDARAVPTDAWVEQLIALADSSPEIGLVGPMSDGAEPPRRVTDVPTGNRETPQQFAIRWRLGHRGQWLTTTRLSSFCLLLKRGVLEAIRRSAEPDRLSAIDAGALASRVQQAGFTLAVAHDLFVPWEARPTTFPAAQRPTRIEILAAAEFAQRFGGADCGRAVCGYTTAADTQAVLSLLVHARPRRILEIGAALGHMTANFTEWAPEDAQIYTLGIVRGMEPAGAPEQGSEIPDRGDFGRFAHHFGKAHKVCFIMADSESYDFTRLAPLEFVLIDGGHDRQHVTSDTLKSYAALAPGGWLVWHDFGSPHPWICVREAIEALGLAETVDHIAGTQVAFLRKGSVARGASGGQEPLRLI